MCFYFLTRATCPTHLTFLHITTRTMSGEQHKSWSSKSCNFLRSPATLGPSCHLTRHVWRLQTKAELWTADVKDKKHVYRIRVEGDCVWSSGLWHVHMLPPSSGFFRTNDVTTLGTAVQQCDTLPAGANHSRNYSWHFCERLHVQLHRCCSESWQDISNLGRTRCRTGVSNTRPASSVYTTVSRTGFALRNVAWLGVGALAVTSSCQCRKNGWVWNTGGMTLTPPTDRNTFL